LLDLTSRDKDKGRGRERDRRGEDRGGRGDEGRRGRTGRENMATKEGGESRRGREGGISPPRSFLKVGAYGRVSCRPTPPPSKCCFWHILLHHNIEL